MFKKNLLTVFLVITIFLAGCKDDSVKRKYEMTLLKTGEVIVVDEYEYCGVYESGIGCWKNFTSFTKPDSFYLVESFREIE